MFAANLSGYPTRPDLGSIRKFLEVGGENPFTAAVKKAVQDQKKAGMNLITDGQVREIVPLIASRVPGMVTNSHTCIKNKLGLPREPTLSIDFLAASREYGDANYVKAVLPGPFSFADNCHLSHTSPYRSNRDTDLLFDITAVLRFEIESLKEYKVRFIQIIEPAASINEVEVFLEILSILFKRVKTPVCHVQGDVIKVFPQLLDAKIAVISFDVVNSPQNLELLKSKELFEVYEKIASVGCIDSSEERLESIESIEKRVIAFVDALGYESVWISPSGSLAGLSRNIAFNKLLQLKLAKERIASRNM
jgi:5-methyltetrahydropteroyltriglutamate--homocysteine methyltransferase